MDVAVTRSERTEALLDGKVLPGALSVNWLSPPINEMFTRMLRGQDFAASEMSLTYAMLALDLGEAPLVTLPVFLDRTFRHRDVYIRADGKIQAPSDLVGRTFGLPDFYSSDGLWIRALLRDGCGVDPLQVGWAPFRAGRRLDTLPETKYRVVDQSGANPEELLRGGQVDAIFVPTLPGAFRRGELWIRRLFKDPEPEEQAYYLRTGVFPISHTLVMRKDLYEADPGAAVQLYEGFSRARDEWASSGDHSGGAWEDQAPDMWPYGVARNRLVLEKAIVYALEDGLLSRRYEPEELFVAELRDT